MEDKSVVEPPLKISGDANRYNHREGNDDYTQPGNLFRLFSPEQKARLFSNITTAMSGVPEFIVERQLGHFDKADPAYGAGVRAALKAAGNPTSPNTAKSPAEELADVSNGFLTR